MKHKKALILVDMQNYFLKNMQKEVRRELIQNQQEIVKECVKKNIPIIELEYKCLGVFRGHTVADIQKEVSKGNFILVEKENNSGFTNTRLHETLRSLGVKELILIGINANGCVQDTAIAALHRKYKVTTASDVIASVYRSDIDLSPQNKKWFKSNTRFLDSGDELKKVL